MAARYSSRRPYLVGTVPFWSNSQESGKPLPAIGEYWHRETGALTHYLDQCGQVMRLPYPANDVRIVKIVGLLSVGAVLPGQEQSGQGLYRSPGSPSRPSGNTGTGKQGPLHTIWTSADR